MQSVRVLMDHIVDYAGLFPPARLGMLAAVRNYATYLKSDDAWMLGRFIVPASRLEEFETAAEAHLPRQDDAEPWSVSALIAPAEEGDSLRRDLDEVARFNETHAESEYGRAVIETVELRAASSGAIDAVIDLIPDNLDAFFELSLNRDARGMIAALAGTGDGAKARTGGIKPDLFPQPAHVARFIRHCAAAEVPFKATAGLHHPFTHRSKTVAGATEFGFVNLFFGAAIAMHEDPDDDTLTALLSDQDAKAFMFEDESIGWREHRLTNDQVSDTRFTFALAYGSCSFEEPLDDLRQLKLLA